MEGVTFTPHEQVLAESDVISLHAPLMPSTRNLIDINAFRKMKRNALLINTARGGLVDEAALIQALDQGLIAGAGFDGTNLPLPTQIKGGGCLSPTDGNAFNNKPYNAASYPAATQRVNVYVCYTFPGGGLQLGQLANHPTDNSWRLGDINVSMLMNFGLITPFIQSIFGAGIPLAYNEHFTIQGKP